MPLRTRGEHTLMDVRAQQHKTIGSLLSMPCHVGCSYNKELGLRHHQVEVVCGRTMVAIVKLTRVGAVLMSVSLSSCAPLELSVPLSFVSRCGSGVLSRARLGKNKHPHEMADRTVMRKRFPRALCRVV